MPEDHVVAHPTSSPLITRAALLSVAIIVGACEPDTHDVTENLSYDSAIGYHGTFDLYEPKSDSTRVTRAAILAIHGGAWKGGDKAWGEQIAKELCPYGYVVFAINYRLAGQPNGAWPAQIE